MVAEHRGPRPEPCSHVQGGLEVIQAFSIRCLVVPNRDPYSSFFPRSCAGCISELLFSHPMGPKPCPPPHAGYFQTSLTGGLQFPRRSALWTRTQVFLCTRQSEPRPARDTVPQLLAKAWGTVLRTSLRAGHLRLLTSRAVRGAGKPAPSGSGAERRTDRSKRNF